MNKGLLAGLIVVGLIAVGAFVFLATGDDSDPLAESVESSVQSPASEQTITPPANTEQDEAIEESATTFSIDEVAIHNSRNDCWTIVNGSVYDITSYLPRHPGGNVILEACGTDGTTLFTQRETQEGETIGSGTPHSSNASAQLEALKIGELAL